MITRSLPVLAMLIAATAGCTDGNQTDEEVAPSSTSAVDGTSVTRTSDEIDVEYDLPAEARRTDGGGDPRGPSYWLEWNGCAPENRAAEAAANGGRLAGFVLVDDVLDDPGVGLGNHVLTTCEESVALLEGRTAGGDRTDDPASALARQLLAAELNLNVGAETCPVADEAVVGAHLVLAAAQFDGASSGPLEREAEGSLPQLVELLAAYNSGELCR